MKHKHPGTNIIKQLPVSVGPTYKQVANAVVENKKRYSVSNGLYEKYRGENI